MDKKGTKEQEIIDKAYEVSKEVNEICSNTSKRDKKEEEQEER